MIETKYGEFEEELKDIRERGYFEESDIRSFPYFWGHPSWYRIEDGKILSLPAKPFYQKHIDMIKNKISM